MKSGYSSKFTEHQRKQWLEILASQNYKCAICLFRKPLTVDHIVPLGLGGKHNMKNIQGLCRECNLWKADRILEEAEIKERRRILHPYRPELRNKKITPAWKSYLVQLFNDLIPLPLLKKSIPR